MSRKYGSTERDLNPRMRFCRPPPNHSAIRATTFIPWEGAYNTLGYYILPYCAMYWGREYPCDYFSDLLKDKQLRHIHCIQE